MPRYIKIIDQVVSPERCAQLLERFQKDPAVQPDPQPEYSTRTYLNLSENRGWMREVQQVTQIADPLIADYFALPETYQHLSQREWLNDGWIMAHYRPGDSCAFHDDAQNPIPPANGLRLATMIFFLNDVAAGGELYFPCQNLKVKPVRGRVVIFPAQLTHPHEVLATETDRFVLQTWVIDPDLIVIHRER